MKPNRQYNLFLIAIVFTLSLSLLNPMTVFADDSTPPVPTEEPAQPPIDDSSAVKVPAPMPESTMQTDANADVILSQVPQETEAVVLNESGQPEPLVTQKAIKTVQSSDPIWCKDNVSPNPLDTANCTSSYTGLQDLLDYLSLNQPTVNGTIWIESNYDSSSNDVGITAFTLDGATLTTWAAHSLTLQGGWDGNSGSVAINSLTPSLFNGASLNIINWGNAVTINDIMINNTNGDGLTVTTTGDIVLHNVQSDNNTGMGAHIDNISGSGSITLTGKNIFNNNTNLGLLLSSCGIISINNLSANNNGAGASIGNGCNSNAGLQGIKLTGKNSFNGNDSFGLYVQSKGNISLHNISASRNGFFGAVLDTCIWNPTAQACGGVGDIALNGENTFNGNDSSVLAGLNALSAGRVTINNITSIGNSGDGVYLEIGQPSLVNFGCIKNNGGYGIQSYGGPLTLNGVTFDGNSQGDVRVLSGYLISDSSVGICSRDAGGVTENISLPIHYVETTSSQTVKLDCELFSGTVLTLPNSDSAYFPCPLSDSASLTSKSNNELPGILSDGTKFSSGFTTAISKDGENQNIVDEFIRISFKTPEGLAASDLAILYWDGIQWVELTDGLTLEDGRKVALGGSVSADGLYFEALVNFTGTFVLVQK